MRFRAESRTLLQAELEKPQESRPVYTTGNHVEYRSMNDDSTKKRILEAAERLLENGGGLEAMTVRAIAKEADVPLASINYHFGSKETLIDQIVENKNDAPC